MPDAVNMLTLTMRREDDDSKSDAYTRQRSRDSATGGGDEFVDISQVQQLLLDAPANGGHSRGRGREFPPPPPPPPPSADNRGRLLDAFAAPHYYYGGYGQHHAQPAASVDDLVALWFAGPSTSSGVCLLMNCCMCGVVFICTSHFAFHVVL